MPNHKSAKKRVRTNEKSRLKNKSLRSAVSTAIKKVLSAPTKEDALKQVKMTNTIIDKACQKGLYHPNNAARKKSRLMRIVNAG